ncbi:MAG: NAD-dependent epimerase/dehydratase family protein [archaeon]|jgi:nucleoside-diphosphate-sugar epimerase
MKQLVMVTGASGFVGKFVVAELKNSGYSVKEFDIAKGQNILDRRAVAEEVDGIDSVIHLAAIVENGNPKLWEVNVEGTKILAEEAAKAGVKKFILLSSTGVYGETKKEIDEKSELKPENKYEESKLEAEKIVLEKKGKMQTVVLRSALILGPNEYWARMFKLLRKKMPLPCNGKNSFQVIHVKDTANALVKMIEKGKNGEIYLAAGEEKITLNEFCETVQEKLELKKGVKHIPSIIAILIGKIVGIKVLTAENIRHISKERKYPIEKIEKLGWKPGASLKKRIAETIEELKEKGIL